MTIDESLLGNITRVLAALHGTVTAQGSAVSISLEGESSIVHAPEILTGNQGAQVTLSWLARNAPVAAQPIVITFDPKADTAAKISLGGVPVPDVRSLESTVRDILFIDKIISDSVHRNADSYGVGRTGRMNAHPRIATLWAGSPTEVMLKVLAVVEPGYSSHVDFALDAEFADDLEVRSLSTWQKINVADALAEARKCIRMALDRNEPNYG